MKKTLIFVSLLLLLTFGLTACGSSSASTSSTSSTTTNQKPTKKQQHTGNNSILKNQALLHVLKMDPQSLRDEFNSGKSIVEIGKEENITEDQMVNSIIQQRIDAAKKNGKTDDQINQAKAQWTAQIKKQLERAKPAKTK